VQEADCNVSTFPINLMALNFLLFSAIARARRIPGLKIRAYVSPLSG